MRPSSTLGLPPGLPSSSTIFTPFERLGLLCLPLTGLEPRTWAGAEARLRETPAPAPSREVLRNGRPGFGRASELVVRGRVHYAIDVFNGNDQKRMDSIRRKLTWAEAELATVVASREARIKLLREELEGLERRRDEARAAE
jgi:hypothetical protein